MAHRRERRTLERAALAWLRAQAAIDGARATAQALATGLFSTALAPEEQRAVSVAVYDRSARAGRSREVAAWEAAWLERRLPPPPARVLVGAAGEGADARHLIARGYRVDAFEPAPDAAARCRATVGIGEVWVATCEQLARAILDGNEPLLPDLVVRRYDAVVLGFGSLSHVLEARERARTVAAAHALCPRGPILVSWLAQGGAPSRAEALGRALGSAIARRRGRAVEPGTRAFQPWFGFAHLFAPGELEALAAACGRRVVTDEDGTSYPHATLLP